MNIKGIVKVLEDTQEIGEKGFKKRLIVVTTQEQYPQDIAIEFTGDKTSLLDEIAEGETVDVSINIRGREYNGKYYTSIQGWKIDTII
jgi:hypothetical protein